jgi:DNA polymerase-3 subunit delta'
LIELQDGDRKIKIDAVRAVRRSLALSPYESKFQIALFINFDLATEQAANAILKTLEEPSDRVLLLITADSAESLPSTIASRCEVIRLRTLQHDQLSQDLLSFDAGDKNKTELAARMSGGRPGLAINLINNEEEMHQRQEWVDDLINLIGADHVARFAYADEAAKDRESLNERLEIWLSFWRDLLLSKHNQAAEISYLGQQSNVAPLKEKLKKKEMTDFLEILQNSLLALQGNVNTRLTMESLLLSLPKLS